MREHQTYDPATDTVTSTAPFHHQPRHARELCTALAKRGTGQGICGRPLDDHGCCDRAGDHL